jgi:hypothetical protein
MADPLIFSTDTVGKFTDHLVPLHGLDPHAYLRDMLERLPTTPASRIGELLPGAWKSAREIH